MEFCLNHPERKSRSRNLCGSCYNRWLRQQNPSLKDKDRQLAKKWRLAHPNYGKQQYAKIRADPERKRKHQQTSYLCNKRRRYKKYGVTEEIVAPLMLLGCKVCKSKERLHVDHCHKTGKFRGILCAKCNKALGLLNDSTEQLQNMINYLNSAK